MARATSDPTLIPRVADLLRDPEIRKSYRRRPLPRGGMSGMIRQMIESDDVIGRDVDGTFFILVSISQPGFTWLCRFGERFADLEPDNEDCGEDELPPPMHYGAGDPDDAEEDDPAEQDDHPEEDDPDGGNIEDQRQGPERDGGADPAFVAAVRARCGIRDRQWPRISLNPDGSLLIRKPGGAS